MPNFSIPQSAMSSLDVMMQATAHNIANINTDGYKSLSVTLQSGPYHDEGVSVGAVTRDMSPGPAVITHLGENDVRQAVEFAARGMRVTAENYDSGVLQDHDRLQQANAADAWQVENHRKGQSAYSLIHGLRREGSNVDLPREFAHLVVTENAYSANAVTIRAWDELAGSIANVKV
jgi:flagellar basal body rod protein FlgG